MDPIGGPLTLIAQEQKKDMNSKTRRTTMTVYTVLVLIAARCTTIALNVPIDSFNVLNGICLLLVELPIKMACCYGPQWISVPADGDLERPETAYGAYNVYNEIEGNILFNK